MKYSVHVAIQWHGTMYVMNEKAKEAKPKSFHRVLRRMEQNKIRKMNMDPWIPIPSSSIPKTDPPGGTSPIFNENRLWKTWRYMYTESQKIAATMNNPFLALGKDSAFIFERIRNNGVKRRRHEKKDMNNELVLIQKPHQGHEKAGSALRKTIIAVKTSFAILLTQHPHLQ